MGRRNGRHRVKALRAKGRKTFIFRWQDRITGRWREKTSDIPANERNRRKAERAAAQFELELATAASSSLPWRTFTKRYAAEYLPGLAEQSRSVWYTVERRVNKHINPELVSDIDADMLSVFAARLRSTEIKETSIRSYLKTLHAALWWAGEVGIIEAVPKLPSIRRAKGITKTMRSRPVKGEEFERMLRAVRKVRTQDTRIWRWLLKGLYLGGLRISEAVTLSWEWDSPMSVVLDTKYPTYRIFAEGEKGHTDRLLPIAPEFVRLLRRQATQRGRVFRLGVGLDRAARVISDIGDAAGIITNADGKTATAHDLRRSFGTRWAQRLVPAELKELMRHRSIETTMSYYVHLDPSGLGAKLWQTGGKTGETAKPPQKDQVVKDQYQ